MPSMSKLFGGKEYNSTGFTFRRKKEAQARAEAERRKGFKARVVKATFKRIDSKPFYYVYVRRQK